MPLRSTRRVTSLFLQSIPPNVEKFNASIYAIVKRKKEKEIPDHEWGIDARIDPCILDWDHMTISMTLPDKINHGIESFDDLDPHFYEGIEATFISMIYGCQ